MDRSFCSFKSIGAELIKKEALDAQVSMSDLRRTNLAKAFYE